MLLHAPSGASLHDFWRFGLFSGAFFDVFSAFFWYTLWYFFPMILTLIRATEEKLIDRAELIRWIDKYIFFGFGFRARCVGYR